MATVTVVTETNGSRRPATVVIAVCATAEGAEMLVDGLASQPGATSAWGTKVFPVLEDWEAQAYRPGVPGE